MARTLTIRYTSDTHGYLYPTNYADMQDRPMGLMKLAGEYPHDGNTLIIDGGDTIQGSPLTNLYQRLSPEEKAACLSEDTYGTHPIAAMMNLAGYQFVTLGNHDFNYGVDALMDYLTNLDALCLCANIRDREGRLPIAPYAVHRLENGLRMAEGLLFEDELFQAPALIRAKRAAAFDAVILEYRQRPGSIMASFAGSARWCASYAQVCARLDALARTLPSGAARAALQRRVGQIALNVGKNIPAYRLPPTVAGEAMAFLKAHRWELARYALKSGDAAIAAQGALLLLSPKLFVGMYRRVMP
mgnify:FL=1